MDDKKFVNEPGEACGFHVIVEGFLSADHYGGMLTTLISTHPDPRRHATKPQAAKYAEAEMRG